MHKVGIFGVPRSGTSWLGQILNSAPSVLYKYQPLYNSTLTQLIGNDATPESIQCFFDKLYNTVGAEVDQHWAKELQIIPNFKKEETTHIVFKEVHALHLIEHMLAIDKNLKIIGIIRSPLSVINSWLLAPLEFRRDLGWKELEEWNYAPKKNAGNVAAYYGFCKWKEAAMLFEHLAISYPNNFYLIAYQDLLDNIRSVVKALYNFCSLSISDQTLHFLNQSRSTQISHTYSVFNAKKHDLQWQQMLHTDIVGAIIKDVAATPLEKYLYNTN